MEKLLFDCPVVQGKCQISNNEWTAHARIEKIFSGGVALDQDRQGLIDKFLSFQNPFTGKLRGGGGGGGFQTPYPSSGSVHVATTQNGAKSRDITVSLPHRVGLIPGH